jgi:hypothetical protein
MEKGDAEGAVCQVIVPPSETKLSVLVDSPTDMTNDEPSNSYKDDGELEKENTRPGAIIRRMLTATSALSPTRIRNKNLRYTVYGFIIFFFMIVLLFCGNFIGIAIEYTSLICKLENGPLTTFCAGIDSKNQFTVPGQKIRRIVLIGDSQVSRANKLYNMGPNILSAIKKRFPSLPFDLITSGLSNDMLPSLKNRVYRDCLNYQPDAIILLWDSDCTVPSLAEFTENFFDQYTKMTVDLINTFKLKAKFVAIAGPVLYGELPDGQNPYDEVMNKCTLLNQIIAQQNDVQFINLRSIFQAADKAKGWSKQSGYLTLDGMHPSASGAALEERAFVDLITSWYSSVVS